MRGGSGGVEGVEGQPERKILGRILDNANNTSTSQDLKVYSINILQYLSSHLVIQVLVLGTSFPK